MGARRARRPVRAALAVLAARSARPARHRALRRGVVSQSRDARRGISWRYSTPSGRPGLRSSASGPPVRRSRSLPRAIPAGLRRSCGTGQSRRSDGRPSTRGAARRTSIARRLPRCETLWGARSSPESGSTVCAPSLVGDEQLEAQIARLDRHFMAPSTAAEWIQVESETDVTAVLPLLRCRTLVLDYEQSATAAAQSRHVQVEDPRRATPAHLRRALRIAVRRPRPDRRGSQGVHRS